MKRPTHKELNKKIREARFAAENGNVNLVNPIAVASDAAELGYSIETQLEGVLDRLLEKASPENYVGRRPPARSYQDMIFANPLYAFKIAVRKFNCLIYFKFSLYENQLWVVSLHRNRKKGGSQ